MNLRAIKVCIQYGHTCLNYTIFIIYIDMYFGIKILLCNDSQGLKPQNLLSVFLGGEWGKPSRLGIVGL
jgi:hypothetical protein